jgi:hypothetical protein
MRQLVTCLVFALAMFASVTPASAQSYVYAVHGIPGANGFPVDIAVDGVCTVKGFTFGTVGGPLSLSPGSHTVDIYVADTLSPCKAPAALSATPALENGKTYALIAHLTEGGSPNLSGVELDLSRPAPGKGRFILHHTAAAPAVDVRVYRGEGKGRTPSVSVPGFKNLADGGAQVPAEFQAGEWNATLSVGGDVVFGPTTLKLKPRTAQLIFAVGVFPDTFQYIVKEVQTK